MVCMQWGVTTGSMGWAWLPTMTFLCCCFLIYFLFLFFFIYILTWMGASCRGMQGELVLFGCCCNVVWDRNCWDPFDICQNWFIEWSQIIYNKPIFLTEFRKKNLFRNTPSHVQTSEIAGKVVRLRNSIGCDNKLYWTNGFDIPFSRFCIHCFWQNIERILFYFIFIYLKKKHNGI